MVENTQDNDETIKCMDMAYTSGKMVDSMKECIKIMQKMVMEYTYMMMEEFTTASGKMVDNMDTENINIKRHM